MKDRIIEINGDYWPKISANTYKAARETEGMLSALLPFLNQKRTMVQAGGNCGLTVRQFVEKFETIYTFEPDPLNFYCLNLNLPYENVLKFQACLGQDRKLVKLDNQFPQDCGAIHVSPNDQIGAKIPTLMIDDLGLTDCDLICLDVEGYEYNVLLGAVNTLKNYKPLLCLEYCASWMERYSSTKTIIDNFLDQMGYITVAAYRTSYSTDIIYSTHSTVST